MPCDGCRVRPRKTRNTFAGVRRCSRAHPTMLSIASWTASRPSTGERVYRFNIPTTTPVEFDRLSYPSGHRLNTHAYGLARWPRHPASAWLARQLLNRLDAHRPRQQKRWGSSPCVRTVSPLAPAESQTGMSPRLLAFWVRRTRGACRAGPCKARRRSTPAVFRNDAARRTPDPP